MTRGGSDAVGGRSDAASFHMAGSMARSRDQCRGRCESQVQ